MKLHQKLRRTTVAAAASLAFAFCAGTALAQPAGMHGPHGGGSPDDMIGHLIAHAKTQLNLNTSQQGMFDSAVASSKAARESGRALHQTVHDALAAVGEAEPDLAAVAAAADNAQAQGQHCGNRPRPVARALRDVHAGPEGGRQDHVAEPHGEGRFVPAEDDEPHGRHERPDAASAST